MSISNVGLERRWHHGTCGYPYGKFLYIHMEKIEFNSFFTPHAKINSRHLLDLSLNGKIAKLLV